MKHLHWYQSDHLLTRFDARVKLLSALALLVMVLTCRGLLFPVVIACCGLGLCLRAGIPLRLLLLRLAQPFFIASVVLLLKVFTGHETLFSWSLLGITITGHGDGLRDGLHITSRILGAVSVVMVVGSTTPFTDLMGALAWLRVPRGLIEVALFAWRYLFLLLDDATVIYHAQKNRLGYTGYRRGLRSFGALTGSLVIKAFDNSQTITTAMVQRGYDGHMPFLTQKRFRLAEVALSILFVAGMGVVWKFDSGCLFTGWL